LRFFSRPIVAAAVSNPDMTLPRWRRYAYVVAFMATAALLVSAAGIRLEECIRTQCLSSAELKTRLLSPNGDGSLAYYQSVLKQDPGNLDAIKALGRVYFELKKFDQAREYERKAIQLAPGDATLYYSIAMMDWTQTNQSRTEAMNRMEGFIKNMKACENLKAGNGAKINEGIEMLERALELRPDYDDARALMSLLWCEKAYIECGDHAASWSDLENADRWINKNRAHPPQYHVPAREKIYTASLLTGFQA
jgi:tetratricopeptide (TPR) repeat protein